MTAYKNFIVDFPARLRELDLKFRPLAESAGLEVSYLLMKLTASFLLPYERIGGTSGARRSEISDPQRIRKFLELDKRFGEASYCLDAAQWVMFDVDDFHRGPREWPSRGKPVDSEIVFKVLHGIRHAVAHSNLFFGGELTIDHIYLGNRRERDTETDKYSVLRCSVGALNHLVDHWIVNVGKLRASPYLIWRELDKAA